MPIERLDHLVLTVRSVEGTVDFYTRALGMAAVTFGDGRRALRFGDAKINLHQWGEEFAPYARAPTPGSADLCFTTHEPVGEVAERLRAAGVAIELGPVERDGARGPLRSIYFRDLDGNLLEVANEIEALDDAPPEGP